MTDCPFCQITRGETPAAVVHEDDLSVAFLDRRPLFPGHTLLIPRAHHETLMDLPPGLAGDLFERARVLSVAIEQSLQAEGLFVGLNNRISQSVPHLHLHLVPRRKGDGLKGFFWPRHPYESEAEMERTAERIRAAMQELRGELGE
jgi:histidine triad (HIT) family protein